MIRMTPDFYDQFRCIGGACQDNCCIGWEIDVDRDALEKYRAVPGAFGERLRQNIVGDPPHFRLNGERCAFLNGDNLCDIILWGGEQMLCEICDQHPRFRAGYGDRLEVGAGLCCEVAARQWLCGSGPVRFVERTVSGAPGRLTRKQQRRLEALLPLRARMLEILALEAPLGRRLARLVRLADRAQQALDAGKPKRIASLLSEAEATLSTGAVEPSGGDPGAAERLDAGCLSALKHMEPIDENWSVVLARLEARLPVIRSRRIAPPDRENAYARLATYAVYRYLLKGVFDGDVLSRARWAAVMVWITRRLDALLLLEASDWSEDLEISAAKLLSRQVEYSRENMTLMLSECWNSRWMTTQIIAEAAEGEMSDDSI